MPQYDAVIIGSGPAGASCARFLADSGKSVVLVERMHRNFANYHRVCGGAVSAKGSKHIGLREDEILNKVSTLRLKWPGGVTTDIRVKGYIIDRPKMLSRMRKEVLDKGGEYLTGRAVDFAQSSGECTTYLDDGRRIRSKYLIGADGAFSQVRKTFFPKERPSTMIKVVESISDKPVSPILSFNVDARYHGLYSWQFPYGSGCSRGTGYDQKYEIPGKLKGRYIPTGSLDQLYSGNVMLIGDAAALANPVSGGGLRSAFESAENACRAINLDDPAQYQKWWEASTYSSVGFENLHSFMASTSNEDFADFSCKMTHRNLYLNGIHSVLHRPRYINYYFGCLQSLHYGW